MIVRCKSGAQIVIGACPWVPGVYLSVGTVRGSTGAVLDPDAIDATVAELTRLRADIAERDAARRQRKVRAA